MITNNTREKMIEALVRHMTEDGPVDGLSEIFRSGLKGFDEMTDEELAEAHADAGLDPDIADKIELTIEPHEECTGVEIYIDGTTLHFYRSTIDGRMVLEVETDSSNSEMQPFTVEHDREGRPMMKIMLNECIAVNEGGTERVSDDPQTMAQDVSWSVGDKAHAVASCLAA